MSDKLDDPVMIVQPFDSRYLTTSSPMPRLPPVITQTLPASEPGNSLSKSIFRYPTIEKNELVICHRHKRGLRRESPTEDTVVTVHLLHRIRRTVQVSEQCCVDCEQ